MATEQSQHPQRVVIYDRGKQKTIILPDYGEVKITCHDGKVKIIEQTTKEQM